MAFQQKCLKVYRNMQKNGKTIVFVSHSLESIKEFCNKAIWINEGVVVAAGDTKNVIAYYSDFTKVPNVKPVLPEIAIDFIAFLNGSASIKYRILSGPDGDVMVEGVKELPVPSP